MGERMSNRDLKRLDVPGIGDDVRMMARELMERRAVDDHRRRSDEELIQRRQADLTDAERVALRELDKWCDIANVWDQWHENDREQAETARRALSKLLGERGE